ncbi:hypothetical protein HOD75_02915 [archaeon]|mgnify:CR=1 FL=1|jgi:hypothetical protein|nr:hypothetical protein [Candidatus Woesearchaeota archaeon]MBT4135622.1 hypothetical protein [archaeon]MBT4241825.1 hypothetical protein [archaeon]MBT4418373.1 hypothetical protein [archaeon]
MKLKPIIITLILIIISITLLLTLFSALFLTFNQSITGNAIQQASPKNITTYTKAICNSSNYCQDYILECNNNNLTSKNPITGAAVQFPENWEDPRTSEQIKREC